MTKPETNFTPAPVPDGIVEVGTRKYMEDAKGALVPLELIKPQFLLEDEQVRKIMGFAIALSEQISRFRGHTSSDLGELDALLLQEYGVKKGGPKGNRQYRTHDGAYEVKVRVQDQIEFGPELQIAKTLVDECLIEWAEDARPEIRAIVTRAFNTDKEGRINRSEIFMLLRLDIEDERWKSAMRAVRDAMRVIGSRQYFGFHVRAADGKMNTITIDLASA